MFGFFKKQADTKAPSWSSLKPEQQAIVAHKIASAYKNMARYKIVSGFDQYQRERGQIERKDENEILSAYERGRLLDMARNAVRNSATFNTILKQMDYNVCGIKAGKVILNFPDAGMSKELQLLFSQFTRSADFFDGLSFNALLKLILKTQLVGGDAVVLFDNGLIEDSGKLLVYESDEIGSTTDEAIEKHFGKGARQSLGKVYSPNGRWIGAVVSRSQRGADVFDPDKSYFLSRDPDASMFDSLWLMPSNVWRVNQGRGITQSASSLGAIIDLEDLCGFELAAAKKNSQTFA